MRNISSTHGGFVAALLAASAFTPAQAVVAPQTINLQVTLRDFSASHPDFQKHITGHQTGCVENILGANRTPVLSAKGKDRCKIFQFDDWYQNSERSLTVPASVTLTEDPARPGVFVYDSQVNSLGAVPHSKDKRGGFFPLDGVVGPTYDANSYKHNYHFTLEAHGEFTYQPGQTFHFRGDDDVWVFINKQLVVDIGGIHTAVSRAVDLDRLGLTPGEKYPLDFFFAERHYSESNFRLEMGMVLESEPPDPGEGVKIPPLPVPEVLDISCPAPGSHWHIAPGCAAPAIKVCGKAALHTPKPLDLALVIDTSGSTALKTGNGSTVHATELEAARQLIGLLKDSDLDARLSLSYFGSKSGTVSALTNDWAMLLGEVDTLPAPSGGTLMAAGIDQGVATLKDAPVANGRKMILITDGVPTLPQQPIATQEPEDVEATMQAAERASDAGVQVYPIVIQRKDGSNTLDKTTMPAVQAITGAPGEPVTVAWDNVDSLADILLERPLTDVTDVTLANLESGKITAATVKVDGKFEGLVPVQAGDNRIQIRAHAGRPDKAMELEIMVPVFSSPVGGSQPLECLTQPQQ